MSYTTPALNASASMASTAPEKGQAYGHKAKQAVSELVFGKQVTLLTHGHDKYGRTIVEVLLPDSTIWTVHAPDRTNVDCPIDDQRVSPRGSMYNTQMAMAGIHPMQRPSR